MRKSRFSEEQIVAALQLVKSGGDVGEICRKLGVTRTTFYRWKSKYGGVGRSETKRPKQLEDGKIEDGLGHGGVAEIVVPFRCRELARHDRRAGAVPVLHPLEQIPPLLILHG